ncbi:MAG: PBP1A family penicillin-binding protein [Rickettsiales bacterium]|nr:PBP1A family penicillin-binding protein [Rickettsiales bacterium]
MIDKNQNITKEDNKKKPSLKWRLTLLSLFLILIIFLSYIAYNYAKLPDVATIRNKNFQSLIHIQDNQEDLIKTIGNQDSNYIIYDDLPNHLINAVLAIEDRKFFNHFGIDFFSIARAVLKNIKSARYAEGASTITQQLAKLYFLSSKKTLKRKFTEMLLAIKLERYFSKEEILELYLNKAYFGSGNYGINSAAQDYFSKKINQLNIHEAALLAGLLKAPSKFSPKTNPLLSEQRTNIVLSAMVEAGFISEEEYVISQYQDNAFNANFAKNDNFKYFTDYALKIAADKIEIFPFDVKLHTSFDKRINEIANNVISNYYKKHSERLNGTQISVIIMRNNGAIVTMLGGKNYKESQFNRAVYAKRQPGSAFKIFPYIVALDNGYKADYKIIDEEIEIEGWIPKNYDSIYRGEITLREAFVRSVNSVAAKLTYELGIDKVINMAHKIGIDSDIPNLPSIALGSNEVNLLEMVKSYAVIANGGYAVEPYLLYKVSDNFGNIFYEYIDDKNDKIIKKRTIEEIKNLLNGVVIWGTGKNAYNSEIDLWGKTGTSQNYRDAWFIGFSRDLTIGIWIGNDANKPLNNITGGAFPALIFGEIMEKIYK